MNLEVQLLLKQGQVRTNIFQPNIREFREIFHGRQLWKHCVIVFISSHKTKQKQLISLQVEVPADSFITDYSDSTLVHRSVIEDLNATIRSLGDAKINIMVESKDFRKGIHALEW
jgi:hypothetical protein